MKNEGMEKQVKAGRDFMKSNFTGPEAGGESDQARRLPQPALSKAALTEGCTRMPKDFENVIMQTQYIDVLKARRSQRHFIDKPIALAQLSFLLWSCQGVEGIIGSNNKATLRPVPSGGARHPFETYISVSAVEGLLPGLYHYLPMEHSLEFLRAIDDYTGEVTCALAGQTWAALAPATIIWTCEPYRGEWRYATRAHRVMLMDIGHVGQNASLSAAAMGLGACCVAAFDQPAIDKFLGVDGEDEFAVYALPVGYSKGK